MTARNAIAIDSLCGLQIISCDIAYCSTCVLQYRAGGQYRGRLIRRITPDTPGAIEGPWRLEFEGPAVYMTGDRRNMR
jgi:hypothetical protein